jgi:aspartyl-tRNA(Asn)/glutamyl-tRNA(Gln) amidotransferase subunit B
VLQETRSFDAANETTFSIRTKEDANDYRYFTDPDLPAFVVTESFRQKVKESLPELSGERKQRLMTQYGLNEKDASRMATDKEWVAYFETASDKGIYSQQTANWMQGPIRSYLNDKDISIQELPLTPSLLTNLIQLIEEGMVSHTAAAQKLFPVLVKEGGNPLSIAESLNLIQDRNADALAVLVENVLNRMPGKVQEYKKGKKGLIGLFVGEVMKESKGKADPKILNQLIAEALNK